MPAPTSTSPAVVALLTLSNAALQRRILSAFKATGQGSILGGHPNPATSGHLKTGHHRRAEA
jgi:hypothetical protein